jgi:3-oxoacyl-[acyl-carrier-protein] synthase-1
MMTAVSVVTAGMVTGVGLSAPASCAAIRCGINNFNQTHFIGSEGNWIVGSEVTIEKPWRGLTKLAKMAASAIGECIDALPKPSRVDATIPLVLCLAEEDRPGRLPGLGGPLLFDIERELGTKFHSESVIVAQGRVGGAVGLLRAQRLLQDRHHPYVILAGVDSYLTAPTLAAFAQRDRVMTAANSNGFMPGEAAAAVLLTSNAPQLGHQLVCRGIGFAREAATIESDLPLRGDGMVQAVNAALSAAGLGLENVDYRISDVSGEQYRFKEIVLATGRLLRDHKAGFGIWHPADCIGEVGAAALPAMLGVLHGGTRKRYLPGPTFLAYLSNDDDKRAALVLTSQGTAS